MIANYFQLQSVGSYTQCMTPQKTFFTCNTLNTFPVSYKAFFIYKKGNKQTEFIGFFLALFCFSITWKYLIKLFWEISSNFIISKLHLISLQNYSCSLG